MRIGSVETFVLHVPVTGGRIADSMHGITHWGVPGVVVTADDGSRGYGFAGTHAHLPTDRLITGFIEHTAAPLLIGEALETRGDLDRLWHRVYRFPPAQWVGRSGITHLGLAAIDVALWDLWAKSLGRPLWMLVGDGAEPEPEPLTAYNTDGGWLNLSEARVVDNCRRFVEEDGFRAVKMKVGKALLDEDLRRVAAVRRAIGSGVTLMVDANGKWNLETALRADAALHELGVFWVEEPLWYDDVAAHARLAAEGRVPIALGEQLYGEHDFRNFIAAGAVRYVQPDVTRLAGVTEWLRVEEHATAAGLPVVAHAGDMGQVHMHLSLARRGGCGLLEYIPWIRDCFVEPVTVRGGDVRIPAEPGAGSTLTAEAMRTYRVA